MSEFQKDKVYVNFRDGYAKSKVLQPRRYTLTHSDITAELFINIGADYAWDKVTKDRDDVLAEWLSSHDSIYYVVHVHLDGPDGSNIKVRNDIFVKELPLALKALHYGDSHVFEMYPTLNSVPIVVYFHSIDLAYNRVENYGTFSDYTTEK